MSGRQNVKKRRNNKKKLIKNEEQELKDSVANGKTTKLNILNIFPYF